MCAMAIANPYLPTIISFHVIPPTMLLLAASTHCTALFLIFNANEFIAFHYNFLIGLPPQKHCALLYLLSAADAGCVGWMTENGLCVERRGERVSLSLSRQFTGKKSTTACKTVHDATHIIMNYFMKIYCQHVRDVRCVALCNASESSSIENSLPVDRTTKEEKTENHRRLWLEATNSFFFFVGVNSCVACLGAHWTLEYPWFVFLYFFFRCCCVQRPVVAKVDEHDNSIRVWQFEINT